MGIYEDLLTRAHPGGFAPIPVPPIDPIEEATAAQAAREAAALRARRGVVRDVPLQEGSPFAFGSLAAGMPAPAPAASPGDFANTPVPVSPIDGPVPLPRARPKEADGAATGETPTDMSSANVAPPVATPAAAPSAPFQPPAPAAPTALPEGPTSFGSLASGLMKGLSNNSATLLALGAGFAGAPNIGQGISRAAAAAIPAAEADRKTRMTLDQQRQSYQALVDANVPKNLALAAVSNPDVMKAITAKYFETKPRVPHKIGTDMSGNDIMGSFDPNTGKYYGANNQELGAGGSTVGLPDAGGGMLAKGVTEVNQDLPASDFKAQFSPAIQAQMEAYRRGDAMPVGNPRLKGSVGKIKEWTTLWAQKDGGVPFSDAEFGKKRTMLNDLEKSGPTSMGGILSNGKSAFGHLANLGDKFVDLNNYSGPNVPGGAHVGWVGNEVANRMLPSPETKGKLEGVSGNALKYGQESTKFYSGTGGGAAERMHALNTVAAPGTLAAQHAAFLQTEKELMTERLHQKEAQVRDALGDDYLARHPVQTPDYLKSVARIDDAIARLKGEKKPSAAPAAAPAGKTSTGVQWSIVQ